MNVELKELADAMDVTWTSQTPLYSPPRSGAVLEELGCRGFMCWVDRRGRDGLTTP
jgi:hypothetical protein